MIDYYSLEKIVDDHRAQVAKAAAEDRLASQAAAARPKRRPAVQRIVAARLRALALATARRLETAAEQG